MKFQQIIIQILGDYLNFFCFTDLEKEEVATKAYELMWYSDHIDQMFSNMTI